MKTYWLTIVMVSAFAAGLLVRPSLGPSAQQGSVTSVPKAWGKAIGTSQGNFMAILLEAPNGTLRIINASSGDLMFTIQRR